MKTFSFPLKGLLEARRAEEEARRAELAAALQAQAAQRRRLDGLLADEARAKQVKRAVLERATAVEDLLRAQRYLEAVGRRVEEERAGLARQDEAASRARAAVVAAMRRLRAVERLEQRRRAEWERAARAEERRSAEDGWRPRMEAV